VSLVAGDPFGVSDLLLEYNVIANRWSFKIALEIRDMEAAGALYAILSVVSDFLKPTWLPFRPPKMLFPFLPGTGRGG